jgi:purine-cytosine permease-like protein
MALISLEDYGTKPVPVDKTKTWFGMGMVIWGISTCIPAFTLGGILAASAKLGPAFAAILIGSAILTVIALATAPALDAVIVPFVLHFILMLATGHKMGLPKES